MSIGEFKHVVLSNGILKASKEIVRNSDTEWEVNSFTDGWCTAYMDLDTAIAYVEGRLKWNDLNWK
jgi:hypothetical protein